MTDTQNSQVALTNEDEIQPREVGDPIPDLNTLQTSSVYSFEDLASAVEFAKVMSQAGPMIPKHCQRQPGVCLAIVYRAQNWRMDPFALALESYQIRDGAPVAYMSSVFSALLINNGINLDYEYDGETHFSAVAKQSAKGNKIADQTASGTRTCTVSFEIAGKKRSYTTPMLKDIKVKNSPLWQNDPDQQLGYYAARAWARRYRPDLMLGFVTVEDVADASPMRNVTPRDEAEGGFSKMIAKARAERTSADQSANLSPEPEPEEAPEEQEIDESHPAYQMGYDAAEADMGAGECPFEGKPHEAMHWLAGWSAFEPDSEESEAEA